MSQLRLCPWLVLVSLLWSGPHCHAGEVVAETLATETAEFYGNRAKFFSWLPPRFRPDRNWRDSLSPWLKSEEPEFSQGYEELVVRDYFRDMKGGTFVDVGCYLPLQDSTTAFLERRLKWSGVAIDAIPLYAEQWSLHRPDSRFLPYAITDKDGETLTFHVALGNSSLNERHLENTLKMLEVDGPVPPTGEMQVRTSTLDTLLDEARVGRIDFLSMDIEGAEPLALAGFDIQRFRPMLVCIERSDEDSIMRYFAENGYELIEKYLRVDKLNWYFRPTADVDPFRG